jgi:hypothetical protein
MASAGVRKPIAELHAEGDPKRKERLRELVVTEHHLRALRAALRHHDFSVTQALSLIFTLVGMDIGLSYLQRFLPALGR